MRYLPLASAAFLAILLCLLAAPVTAPVLAEQPAGADRAAGAGKIDHNRRLGPNRRRKGARRSARRSHQRERLGNGVAASGSNGKPQPPAQSSDILFQSNFEDDFAGWHVQAPAGRAEQVGGGAFSGSANARFEVQPGDIEPETGSSRAEVSGPDFYEGEDIFVRDAVRVPVSNSFSGSWQIIQQLHENDWGGSPGIAVFLDGDLGVQIGSGDGSQDYWDGPELSENRWYDLVYRVHLSQDAGAGFVEVWLDGQQQTLEGGGTRAYGQTIQTGSTYLKAGIYRSKSSSGTSVVEHDLIVVGASLSAVLGA